MPGMVEGHSHVFERAIWRYVYCGYCDRMDPNGKTGCTRSSPTTLSSARRNPLDALDDPDALLSGLAPGPDLLRWSHQDLSTSPGESHRPIGVLNASGHILNVNSKALELAGLLLPGR